MAETLETFVALVEDLLVALEDLSLRESVEEHIQSVSDALDTYYSTGSSMQERQEQIESLKEELEETKLRQEAMLILLGGSDSMDQVVQLLKSQKKVKGLEWREELSEAGQQWD